MEEDELPLDHAAEVLDEFATEEECDWEMDTLFWAWYGPDDDEEE